MPALFDGLHRQTVTPAEIIVVDSGSTDGTVPLAQRAGARVLHIARRDFAFGRSLNVGAAEATGEMLVMASAHTYPATERWLEQLLEPFAASDVALVYGGQRGDHRSAFSEQQILRQWFPEAHVFPEVTREYSATLKAVRFAQAQLTPGHEDAELYYLV